MLIFRRKESKLAAEFVFFEIAYPCFKKAVILIRLINFTSMNFLGHVKNLSDCGVVYVQFYAEFFLIPTYVLKTPVLAYFIQIKCIQYWPNEGSQQWGSITVSLVETEYFSNFIIRTLVIKNKVG